VPLKIVIVAVGKLKSSGLRAELDDYLGRIRRYASCEEIELKDEQERDLVARFDKVVPGRALRVALEVEGTSHDSRGLARFVGQHEQQGSTLAFLIGGAYGLPKSVSSSAPYTWSLSKLTLPHRLARVVLAEQLYRSFTLLRGEPYSH
jgi:23S rRNA (pseudouridine1915-N3)-methyltransferase